MAKPAVQLDVSRRRAHLAGWAALTLGGVLAARTLIPESFEALRPSFLSDVPRGPGPDTAAWLDGICLTLAAVVCVLRGAWRGDRVAWLGIGLLVVAVAISTAAAANRRVALNAGSHLVVLALAAMALRWGLGRGAARQVAIVLLVAAASLNAFKCLTQRAYEFRETLESWQQHKRQLAARGVPVDTPEVRNFERRLRSRQAFGYLYHPNVAAAIMAAALLAVVGGSAAGRAAGEGDGGQPPSAGGARGSRPPIPWLCGLALAALLAVGVYLTGSLGAMVSAAVGGAVLAGLILWARRGVAHRGRTVLLLAALYLGGFAGLVGWGLARGTLPGASLAFRWQYWSAAVQAWLEKPWTGLGRENFAAAYLRHKPIESTEQVRNPHNLWLTLLVETGPLGLTAGVILIGCALAGAVPGAAVGQGGGPCDRRGRLSAKSSDSRGRLSPKPSDSRGGLSPGDSRSSVAVRRRVILAAVVTLGVQALFSRTPFDQPGIAVIWSVEVALVFVALLVTAVVALGGRIGAGLAAGLLAAIYATLVHNLIGFSLFTPAGLAMLAGLVGVATALPDEPDAAGRTLPWVWGVAGVVVLTHAGLVVVPTTRSQAALARAEALFARAETAGQIEAAIDAARVAVAADRWDPQPARALAARVAAVVATLPPTDPHRSGWLAVAERYARLALERQRDNVGALRLLAQLPLLKEPAAQSAPTTRQAAALRQAAELLDRLVQLDPTSLRDRVMAGRLWYQVWRRSHDPQAASRAAEHFRFALRIHARRDPRAADRLSESEVQAIRKILRVLAG